MQKHLIGCSAILLSQVVFAADSSWYAVVDRNILFSEDGHESNTFFVDNAYSTSVIGLNSQTSVDFHKFGGAVELGVVSSSSGSVNQLDKDAGSSITIRVAESWFDSINVGKFSIGYGTMCSDGTATSTLSNASVVAGNGNSDMSGGMYFHQKNSSSRVSTLDPQVSSHFSSLNGLGRANRFRYDSPKFSGFQASGSVGVVNNTQYGSDLSLRYYETFEKFELSGAAAYSKLSHAGNANNQIILDGSMAMLHKDTGINVAVAYANKRKFSDSRNMRYIYIQAGKRSDIFSIGNTNFVFDYWGGKHTLSNNDKAKTFGGGVTQKIDRAYSEIYMSMRKYQLQTSSISYDNIFSVSIGLKVNIGGKI